MSGLGHNPGTATAETAAPQGSQKRTPDRQSSAHGWPRLLNVEQAAQYLGLSFWTLRELVNDGSIPTVRVPRAQTLRMKERHAASDYVRRLLVDRADLDSLVERWKEPRTQ